MWIWVVFSVNCSQEVDAFAHKNDTLTKYIFYEYHDQLNLEWYIFQVVYLET